VIAMRGDRDIVEARSTVRALASDLAFSSTELAMIATTVSELARNILRYAHDGQVELAAVDTGQRRGIQVIARDAGPGIADLTLAMTDGFSTAGGLGLGLPGARRLMDEFAIESAPGVGTTVTVTKWESRR
jgi:serine/threonine-protein kinase RsbT